MAERLRNELGVDVDEEPGPYGEFTVLVDDEPIRRGLPIAVVIGLVPSADQIVAAVKGRLEGNRSPR